jgi:hypothetical protein
MAHLGATGNRSPTLSQSQPPTPPKPIARADNQPPPPHHYRPSHHCIIPPEKACYVPRNLIIATTTRLPFIALSLILGAVPTLTSYRLSFLSPSIVHSGVDLPSKDFLRLCILYVHGLLFVCKFEYFSEQSIVDT